MFNTGDADRRSYDCAKADRAGALIVESTRYKIGDIMDFFVDPFPCLRVNSSRVSSVKLSVLRSRHLRLSSSFTSWRCEAILPMPCQSNGLIKHQDFRTTRLHNAQFPVLVLAHWPRRCCQASLPLPHTRHLAVHIVLDYPSL